MSNKTVLKNAVLVGMLAVVGSAHATPGTDIKTATADVIFSSAVHLGHELHTTADAFRLSDIGTVNGQNGQFNKSVLVAQGKINVASGTWNSADQIVVKFTSGCINQTAQGTGIPVTCTVNGGTDNDAHLMLEMQNVNAAVVNGIDSAGWGIIPEHQGVAYYRVNTLPSTESSTTNKLVGSYVFGVDAAVFEN